MNTRKAAWGFTLVELLVAMTVFAILIALAAPDFGVWTKNNKIRSAAETVTSGIHWARSEAVKRNKLVRFELMPDSAGGDALWRIVETDTNGTDVSVIVTGPRNDVKSVVNVAGAALTGGKIVISADNNVPLTVTAGSMPTPRIVFNGFGQVRAVSSNISTLYFSLPESQLSAQNAKNIRTIVSEGGVIRMCDVTSTQDFRKC